MFSTVLKYLQVKYGSKNPTTMTRKDAATMGIPFPQRPGWLKQHGAREVSRDQVEKMIGDVSLSEKKKTTEANRMVIANQLARLLGEWPQFSTVDSAKLAKMGNKKRSFASVAPKYEEIRACKNPQETKETRVYDGFYESREWRKLRYKALVMHGAKCQCCGATRADGAKLHVDHIKPRSKFPALCLDLANLQILCEDCNLGKSNKDQTDWR